MTTTNQTSDYKAKQEMANFIKGIADKHRVYDNSSYKLFTDPFCSFIYKIQDLDVFASRIAETIEKTILKGETLARMSSKQSWILACAAVENGIEF